MMPIDLRSDAVTRPSTAMRQAMAAAELGDDSFGEDPSINRLQERVAQLLGKEAALWMPTGTMANQVALRALTRPGDDVIVSQECHAVWHEAGGSAANAGVQFTAIGVRGVFRTEQFVAAIKPRGHAILPPTTLVEIENTHNRAGGIVADQAVVEAVCAEARRRGLASFLDGARLWNAALASGRTVAELAAPFDLTAVAFSKGLGAPGGSMLAGSRALIDTCVRHRRMFGGAMRQVGVFAAAALFGLDHNRERLARDHENARLIAHSLSQCPQASIDCSTVQTNIVVFELGAGAPDAARFVALARERGVLLLPFADRTVRAMTHLDVSTEQCRVAAGVLCEILRSSSR